MEEIYKYPAGDFISGFGDSYEQECQDMVIRGMKWFDENPKANPKFKEYKNIYGIISEENPAAESLVDTMVKKGEGATGAMVQACVSHTLYAAKHGWESYIKKITKS